MNQDLRDTLYNFQTVSVNIIFKITSYRNVIFVAYGFVLSKLPRRSQTPHYGRVPGGRGPLSSFSFSFDAVVTNRQGRAEGGAAPPRSPSGPSGCPSVTTRGEGQNSVSVSGSLGSSPTESKELIARSWRGSSRMLALIARPARN